MFQQIGKAVDDTLLFTGDGHCECEIRLGKQQKTRFSTIVSPTFFFSTFDALYNDAASATQKVESTTLFYESIDPRCECEGSARTWVEKTSCGRFVDLVCDERQWWFDLRITRSIERQVDEPERLLQARAQAERVSAKAQNAVQTSPTLIRRRERRSLVFADASAWRIDFTYVSSQRRHLTNHNDPSTFEVSYADEDPRCEIELELDIDTARQVDRDVVVFQAFTLLERLAFVLGKARDEIMQRLHSDRSRAEQRAIYGDE
jgi:hypothetical protein